MKKIIVNVIGSIIAAGMMSSVVMILGLILNATGLDKAPIIVPGIWVFIASLIFVMMALSIESKG